ncbi:unnamed protein product [Orchesella dallaii]|uniref:Uncharacterized protein n=1 Tax=Orchesella dallaii TaxID=48710 RepID=A0ABP1RNC0_9HEXA
MDTYYCRCTAVEHCIETGFFSKIIQGDEWNVGIYIFGLVDTDRLHQANNQVELEQADRTTESKVGNELENNCGRSLATSISYSRLRRNAVLPAVSMEESIYAILRNVSMDGLLQKMIFYRVRQWFTFLDLI